MIPAPSALSSDMVKVDQLGYLPYAPKIAILGHEPDGLGSVTIDGATFNVVDVSTGATVIQGLDNLPESILFYRQQLQWLAGMEIQDKKNKEDQ